MVSQVRNQQKLNLAYSSTLRMEAIPTKRKAVFELHALRIEKTIICTKPRGREVG
jgi:hypothetical protein